MSEIIQSSQALPLPEPRVPITIRAGVMGDLPFLDSLQRMHTKAVGWMPTKQFEGKIAAGHVLIAEIGGRVSSPADALTADAAAGDSRPPERVGYCIGNDRYFKRDDVGIVYQMNVLPGYQRGLIGAALLKAMFERSAYGCKLYCCWCAQDLAANKFWEAMGFVPLAYRAGSEKKSRTHIFWQKRIRSADTTTPWWFPSQTTGGSIRADRIVLPIPPGTHWSDAKPLLLPGHSAVNEVNDDAPVRQVLACREQSKRQVKTCPTENRPATNSIAMGGFRFAPIKPIEQPIAPPKREKQPRAKVKNDPRLVAAARELRDRWLDQVNVMHLASQGKYELCRVIDGVATTQIEPIHIRCVLILPAA